MEIIVEKKFEKVSQKVFYDQISYYSRTAKVSLCIRQKKVSLCIRQKSASQY